MVRSTNLDVPKPESGDEFEQLVADLAEARFGEDSHRHARSGQTDDGVDVYLNTDEGLIGIQCKNTKQLSERTIRDEISSAEEFSPELSQFIFATTAPLDRNTQELIREISLNREEQGIFSIDLWTWDDITRYLNQNIEIFRTHYDSLLIEEGDRQKLSNLGWKRLDKDYFENRRVRDPEVSWQTGFSLAEVKEGHPFERLGRTSENLTDEIIDLVSNEGSAVLLGYPGSGKSTILKRVSCEWRERYDSTTVLYRPSDAAAPSDAKEHLMNVLSDTDRNHLIVVEDVLQNSPSDIFRLVEQFSNDETVHFLFDSRTQEWESFEAPAIREGERVARPTEIKQIEIPPIQEEDVERAIRHFNNIAEKAVQVEPDLLLQRVQQSETGGDTLVLSHLIGLYIGLESSQITEVSETGVLRYDANQTYAKVASQEEVSLKVAVLVSLLSASRITVNRELIHGFVSQGYSHEEIEAATAAIEGDIVYSSEDDRLRVRHEIWSSKFLQMVLEQEGQRSAVNLFEEAANSIFRILDDSDVRESICRWLRKDPFPEDIMEYSDLFVSQIFKAGQYNRNLAPFYSSTEYSQIKLPENTSRAIEVHTRIWRGSMRFEKAGSEHGRTDLELAEEEFKSVLEIAETDDSIPERAAKGLKSLALSNLASVNHLLSDYKKSKEYLTEARRLSQEIDDSRGLANIHAWLGNIELQRGKPDRAEHNYRVAIRYDREARDYWGWASRLSNLAEAKSDKGEYDKAESLTRTALRFLEKTDNRSGQAVCYGRLAEIESLRDNTEAAVQLLETSLRLREDSGSEGEIANNLLAFARMGAKGFKHHDKPFSSDEALEFAREAEGMYRKAGNEHGATIAKGTIGGILIYEGRAAEGREVQREVIEKYRELGDKSNLAAAHTDLAQAHLLLGEFSKAEEVTAEAVEINREIKDKEQLINSLYTRGQVRFKMDRVGAAIEDLLEAARVSLEIGAFPVFYEAVDYVRDIAPDSGIRYGLSICAAEVAQKRDDSEWEAHFNTKAQLELRSHYSDLYDLVTGGKEKSEREYLR